MNVLFGDGGTRMLTGPDVQRLLAAAEAGGGSRPLSFPATAPSGPAGSREAGPRS